MVAVCWTVCWPEAIFHTRAMRSGPVEAGDVGYIDVDGQISGILLVALIEGSLLLGYLLANGAEDHHCVPLICACETGNCGKLRLFLILKSGNSVGDGLTFRSICHG